MKYAFSLFLLAISLNIFCQSPDIDDGNWYLINLNINSENHNRPLNVSGNPMISNFRTTNDGQRRFDTWICDTWFGDFEIDLENSTITFFGLGSTLGGCDTIEYVTGIDTREIDMLFYQFYTNNNEPKVFDYEITEGNLNIPRILKITATNGDYIEYYFNTLSTFNKYSNLSFSIYPNPVVDELLISSSQNLKNYKVEVFDLLGKLKISKSMTSSNSIHVENLSKGMYILLITDELGNSTEKKFVK
ncbi:hypothetical protein GCM10023311_25920 [Flaviramulus aquimarinus]|uniref:Secretion system C-terminal sorting domain-containing protein n=1 Tax=Flaviramulus aquimarinus TaxID=1170456 RepID=A0ABP9FFY1_9FLAO